MQAQADEALRTPGTFRRLRQAMLNRSYESWVRALLEMEDRSTVLRNWEPLVVPGLLQTEAYARAMIRAGRPGDSDAEVEQMVIARISRQAIWDRKDPPPPMLFAVLGEAILRQRVGDAQIMRDQLGHLAEIAGNPRVTVQVLPFGAAAHPGMLGPFLVAHFDSDRDSAYLDNALDGQVTERRNQVAPITLLYDSLRSVALSPGASTELIMKVLMNMADVTGAMWRKSSYSSANGGLRRGDGQPAGHGRGTRQQGSRWAGPGFAPARWQAFLARVKTSQSGPR